MNTQNVEIQSQFFIALRRAVSHMEADNATAREVAAFSLTMLRTRNEYESRHRPPLEVGPQMHGDSLSGAFKKQPVPPLSATLRPSLLTKQREEQAKTAKAKEKKAQAWKAYAAACQEARRPGPAPRAKALAIKQVPARRAN